MDVTKDLNKQQRRKDVLEKRTRAVGMKVDRLQKKTFKLSDENKILSKEKTCHACYTRDVVISEYIAEIAALRNNEFILQQQRFCDHETKSKALSLLDLKRAALKEVRRKLARSRKREKELERKLIDTRRKREALRECARRAQSRTLVLAKFKKKVTSTLSCIEKGAYAPWVRLFVRGIVSMNVPLSSVGPILNNFYQLLIKPLLDPELRVNRIKLSARTAARIVGEGRVAADIQSALELLRTFCKRSKQERE